MSKRIYCTFDVSKLLKEKGFDVVCGSFYYQSACGYNWGFRSNLRNSNLPIASMVSRPTVDTVVDWLSGMGVYVALTPSLPNAHCPNGRYKWTAVSGDVRRSDCCDTFKDAVDSVLKYCLTALI